MILITRCPHCQTTFRVTEDQLKLYEGAVRCGVCQQIFNGTDHLQPHSPAPADKPVTIEKKKQPSTTQGLPSRKTQPDNPALEPPQKRNADDITISLADDDINASSGNEALFDALEEELSTISLELEQVTGLLFGNELDEGEPHLPASINETARDTAVYTPPTAATTHFASLSLYSDPGAPVKSTVYSTAPRLDDAASIAPSTAIEAEVAEPDAPARLHHQRSHRASAQSREPDPLMDIADSHHAAFFEMAEEDADDTLYNSEPDFVKKWRKKKRGSLFSGIFVSLATIALLTTLSIQCLYMFSDRIVVWWPPAEPAVIKACNTLACPRRLETRISALSIESSELQTISQLKDKYTLSLLLRNSGSSYQSWPHLELTLTDKDKKPVVRRAFSPASYLSDANRIIKGIPPYSEEAIRLHLEIKTESSADYRVSLFYP